MKDYYKTLGVKVTDNQESIKRAYRKAALKYHPDKNSSPGAAEMMKAINEAYGVLRDPVKKAQYDATRKPQLHPFTMTRVAWTVYTTSSTSTSESFSFSWTSW